MKPIFFLPVLLITAQLLAQDTPAADSNSVIVHKDARIELLMNKQAQINEESSRDARKMGKGYRLLVIRTNNRDEAISAKTKLYTYFPELKSYLWHQSPYYNVKAGNFKDRKEAEDYQRRLNLYFSKGVFIMNDTVELKPEKSPEEEL